MELYGFVDRMIVEDYIAKKGLPFVVRAVTHAGGNDALAGWLPGMLSADTVQNE
jgi:hypothetical protein